MDNFNQTFNEYTKYLEKLNLKYGEDYLIDADDVNKTQYTTVHILNNDIREKYHLNATETFNENDAIIKKGIKE